jgi:hypothetical protein
MSHARFLSAFAALAAGALLAQACTAGDDLGLNGVKSAGGTTSAGSSSGNPLSGCTELCAHIDAIQCKVWPNCATECANMLGAPAACAAEFAALLDCWVKNENAFTCTMTQVVPPAACQAVESAFHDCVKGTIPAGSDAGCPTQFWVCNSTDSSCGCKTQCAANELRLQCATQGAFLACACYDADTLLGTCTQAAGPCDNTAGCCAPFFEQLK